MSGKDRSQQKSEENHQIDTEGISIKRRAVLQSVSTGIVATTSISAIGTSMADTLDSNEYNATDAQQFLSKHKDLLEELDTRGLLESSSIESLGIDSLSPPSPDSPDGERFVRASGGGEEWTELRISRQTDRGGLAIVVMVERNNAYAIFNPSEDKSQVVITKSETNTNESITPSDYPDREPCEVICPVDGPCCSCVQVCESGCHCRCTPVYVYECRCCALWPLECAINCA